MERKAELLAPAGSYETMTAAFHAGADAVYLGGDKFGARAFAKNFTQNDIQEALAMTKGLDPYLFHIMKKLTTRG